MRNDGAESEDDPPESENPEVQYVWSARYIDAPVLRDRDAGAGGDLGKSGSGLDERLYYTTDANMNVTALVDTSGTVLERVVYDPYGKATFYDGSWTSPSDTSSYDNVVLYCGYHLDAETGLYHVRHRVYHATLGRWVQRDPAGYVDGMGLYQYSQCMPTLATDPTGRWTEIKRTGEARARVCSNQEDDTWLSLAQKVKLDEDEYGRWVKTDGGEAPPSEPEKGAWYTVPNEVLLVYGKTSWYEFGFNIIEIFHSALNDLAQDASRKGFSVDKQTSPTAQALREALASEDLWAAAYGGHGTEVGALMPTKEERNALLPGRYTHHRLALLMLLGCYTAAPAGFQGQFDPATTGGRTDVSEWELNVSSRGIFAGYTGPPNLFTHGKYKKTTPGGARLTPALRRLRQQQLQQLRP